MIIQRKRSPPRTTFLWSSLSNKQASKLTRPLLLLVQISLGTRNYFTSYVHLLSKTLSLCDCRLPLPDRLFMQPFGCILCLVQNLRLALRPLIRLLNLSLCLLELLLELGILRRK